MWPLATVVGLPYPAIGLSLGWLVAVWFVVALLRGKLMTESAHLRETTRLEADHAREIERVDHDRQEWRGESRIKDAQLAERDTQNQLQAQALAAMGDLGRTVEQVVLAVRQIAGGGSP